jgi:hypothetical protein
VSAASAPRADGERPPETFVAVTVRRLRYLVAIALCAAGYVTLGWMAAQPAADSSGVSLVAQHSGIMGFLVLVLVTIAGVAVAIPLCHPDAPYAGMWCTFLGLGGLAIRGGTIRQLLLDAQYAGNAPDFYHVLAVECLQWAAIILAADLTTRFLWHRFYSNVHWIGRSGIDPAHVNRTTTVAGEVAAKGGNRGLWIDSSLALAVTGAVAYLLLGAFLQSQLKQQVLVGSFVCFGIGALAARLVSPNADSLAYWLAVPATAAAGYLMATQNVVIVNGHMELEGKMVLGVYPGQSVTGFGRALPIDYIAGGVPGAILGYYTAVRMHLHSASEKAKSAGK